MLLHRRQYTQVALYSLCVVIVDVTMDHLRQLVLAGEPSAVIALPLQNAPEALHRAIINAVGHTGHTLCHSGLNKLLVKGAVSILKASVTVEQGMCIRIDLDCLVKGLEDQRIVIVLTEHIGHDAPVTEIQNGAQIEFVDLGSLIPLEFCYIGEPLLIGLCSMELPVQKILSKILRVLRLSGITVVVLDCGADIPGPADTEYPLVIDMDTVVMAQVVIEPPIALVRAFRVDLFDLVRKAFILHYPAALLSGSPFVIS